MPSATDRRRPRDAATDVALDRRRRRVAVTAAAMLTGVVSLAPGLTHGADGDTVLTLVMMDAAGVSLTSHDFDLAALAALPQKTLTATTPWYRGTHRFTGPLLRDVLAAGGAAGRGQRLTAVALNDYRNEIPVDDAERWPVIVAMRVDDQPVSVRDKGPLMIMYPFDDDRSLRTGRFFGRAVWQLRTLELR